MSRKRIMYLLVPVLILIPVVALAVDFDWTGGNGNFNVEDNWEPDGLWCYDPPMCYPHTCNDDATIEGWVEVYLVTSETIDDLKLIPPSGEGSVTLDGQDSQNTLTCDSLTIGGDGGSVFLKNKAIIKTQACP